MKFSSAFLGLLLILAGCSDHRQQQIETITPGPSELDWIGSQIFQNECSRRKACLVHWNQGEAFPSLGIGHFIWYPGDYEGPFVESFPRMMSYLAEQGEQLPTWLQDLSPFDAPWPTRAHFQAQSQSPKVRELRDFLVATKGNQAGFLVRRANEALNRVVQAAPEQRRDELISDINALQQTPGGVYALIDYVNFKGEGLASSERYKGEGWGLLQVLQAMSQAPNESVLDAFRIAAGKVLTQRASNAENDIERERWLAGWLNRVDSYREPSQLNPS